MEQKKQDQVITKFELPPVDKEESLAAQNKRLVGSPAWRAGQSGNKNGRPKGTKNKIQGEAKILLQKLGFKAVSRIMEDWDLLTLNQIVTLAPKLFPYISPPVSRLEVDNKFEGDMRFKIEWVDSNAPMPTIDITHQEEENEEDYECQED